MGWLKCHNTHFCLKLTAEAKQKTRKESPNVDKAYLLYVSIRVKEEVS